MAGNHNTEEARRPTVSHTRNLCSHMNSRGSLALSKVRLKGPKRLEKNHEGSISKRIVGEGHIIIKPAAMDQRARPPSLSHLQPENTPASRWGIFIYTYMYMCTHTHMSTYLFCTASQFRSHHMHSCHKHSPIHTLSPHACFCY